MHMQIKPSPSSLEGSCCITGLITSHCTNGALLLPIDTGCIVSLVQV
jgi:hypothetical protein